MSPGSKPIKWIRDKEIEKLMQETNVSISVLRSGFKVSIDTWHHRKCTPCNEIAENFKRAAVEVIKDKLQLQGNHSVTQNYFGTVYTRAIVLLTSNPKSNGHGLYCHIISTN